MTLYLYQHIRNKTLLVSDVNGSTFPLPVFSRQSKVPIRVILVDDNPSGGRLNPISVVDIAPYDLQAFWGTYGTPLAGQDTWTKDTDNNWFAGEIDFNTTQIEALNWAASNSFSGFLEFHLLKDSDRTIYTNKSTIQNVVYNPASPDPEEYTPPEELIDLLQLALEDSNDIDVVRSGDAFHFDLKAAGRRTVFPDVADEAAMLALSTAKKGDVAFRTDGTVWELQGDYSDIDDWIEMPFPASTVFSPVASQAAMLLLAASKGDKAVRTDTNQTFQLISNSPSTLADWIELPAKGLVTSVNGRIGVVVSGRPFPVASQAAMLATGAGLYDFALRSDQNLVYQLTALPATTLGNWTLFAQLPSMTVMTPDDKSRLDLIPGGGFDDTVQSISYQGNKVFCGGTQTAFGNTATPRLSLFDLGLQAIPHFYQAAGWDVAPGRVGFFPDGSLLVSAAAGTQINYRGAGATYLVKLQPNGEVDGAWVDPNTGPTFALMPDLIAIRNFNSLKIVDYDGTVATTIAVTSMHHVATTPALEKKFWLSGRYGSAFAGDAIPRGLKLINAETGALDATFASGAGNGASFTADRIAVSQDGLFCIVGNTLANGGVSYAWNGGSTTKHRGLAKINADGTEDATWDTNIVMADATTPQPLAIDSVGRLYLGGNVSSIKGVTVTPGRLYRLTVDGDLDKEFGPFNGAVTDVALVSDDELIVVGAFTQYGTTPINVGRIVFLHADGTIWEPCCDPSQAVGVENIVDVDYTATWAVNLALGPNQRMNMTGPVALTTNPLTRAVAGTVRDTILKLTAVGDAQELTKHADMTVYGNNAFPITVPEGESIFVWVRSESLLETGTSIAAMPKN